MKITLNFPEFTPWAKFVKILKYWKSNQIEENMFKVNLKLMMKIKVFFNQFLQFSVKT